MTLLLDAGSTRRALPLLLALLLLLTAPAEARRGKANWSSTVEHVSRAVVVIAVSTTRSVDTDRASTSGGTGFIVDKERGLLLTNRHLVHVAPVRARGILLNHEEIELEPVYRDPIHDFGFYRFDPSKIRHMEITELELAPGEARVGTDIRVIGNDAGEKLSILEGTLARLDRAAPKYGRGYNDWNTFYYQAATSTSGGSSGSPVVDIRGRVLALNAGSNRNTASSFYLPIEAPTRALERIQQEEPIARGTIQSVYTYKPYDELGRLGLREETEAAHRKAQPDATGMLVVKHVIPDGPADGTLKPGDIFVSVNGESVMDFETVEKQLNAAVGGTVSFNIERGGASQTVDLAVDDLQKLIPSQYLEYSKATLHALSIQRARAYNHPARGVALADAGYSFAAAGIPSNSIIEAIGETETPDLATLETTLAALEDGARVPVRYHLLKKPQQKKVAAMTVDRHWSPMRLCDRNDSTGLWDCRPSPQPEPIVDDETTAAQATFESVKNPVAAKLAPSLCHVRFTIPYQVEGVDGWRYRGAGVVVDADEGLVITDRGTIPIRIGDVTLTFAGSVRVPAEIVSLHPTHNIALLRYDPAALGDVAVKAAKLSTDAELLRPGDEVHQVGLTSTESIVHQTTEIVRVDPVKLTTPSPPRFRESNVEVYILQEVAPSIGGVLTDDTGTILALWAFQVDQDAGNRFSGLPIGVLHEFVAPFLGDSKSAAKEAPHFEDLGADLHPLSLASARDQGVPDEWISRLTEADPERRQAISIVRMHPESAASESLSGGEVLLAIDGRPITRPRDVERAIAEREGDHITLTLVQDGQVVSLEVAPFEHTHQGIVDALLFGGAILHDPHPQVGLLHGSEPGGVYVAWYWYGTPAARSELRASQLIRSVNEQPISDLATFIEAIRDLEDGEAIRLETESLDAKKGLVTLETDLIYWPTAKIGLKNGEWRWSLLDTNEDAAP